MSRRHTHSRERAYGRRGHDVKTRPTESKAVARDYLNRELAEETELERRARDGDR